MVDGEGSTHGPAGPRIRGLGGSVGLLVLVLGVSLLVPAAAVAGPEPGPAGSGSAAVAWLTGGYAGQGDPGTPLTDAPNGAERTTFSGVVSVDWVDVRGTHRVPLPVTGMGGMVHLDGRESVVMTSQPGPDVAGRPTSQVDVRTQQGQLDEQLDLDDDTGLALRREQFDGGRPVRAVGFTSIRIGAGPVADGPSPVTRPSGQLPATRLAAPFTAPVRLAAGYVLVGVFRRQGVVQVLYSDGLHSLSVFEQTGALDMGGLPRAGQAVMVGPARGERYSWSGGQAVTWQRGSETLTVVGDGPVDDIMDAAGSVPPPRRLSVTQTVRLTCRRLLVEMWRPA